MSYTLLLFDGATLPTRNAEMPLGTGETTPSIVPAAGGAFDRYGTRQVLPQTRRIVYTAGYSASTDAALRTLLDRLRAKVGISGNLIRLRVEDSVQQRITARLLSVDGGWRNEDGRYFAVTCTFETAEPTWRSASATVTSRGLTPASQNLSVVIGGDAPVPDAIVRIGATSGTITLGTVSVSAIGAELVYSGAITAGTVAINAGDWTVKQGTTNKYANFSLGANHTAYGLLPLVPGTATITFAVNGTGTAIVTHYDRWF